MGALEHNKEFLLKAFAKKNIKDVPSIESISFLGSNQKIEWRISDEGLTVKAPSKVVDDMATVIKIVISQ